MRVSRSTKRLRWALLLVGVAAVCLTVFTGYQALKAKDALDAAAANFQDLGRQLTSGDGDAARATLAEAQENAGAARDNTSGPGWWLASRLPTVGDDVTAVRTVADVIDTLAQDVLPRVVSATEALDADRLRPSNGRVDLRPIQEVAPSVVDANLDLQKQYARVADITTADLAAQIASPVSLMQEKLGEAAALSDRASRAVQLLPAMLGAEGKRTYLFLFQNNAELRATGGIPGAFATITADHGKVEMGKQGDAATVGRFDEPPLPLTQEEAALFGEQMGVFPQDVNFTPDFPRSAQLIKAMWESRGGEAIDGVVSTDPVALSYVLRGTGPVELEDGGALTADIAVEQLLNQAYFQIENPAQQNVYFSSVARSVFGAFASGQGEPGEVLRGLVQAAEEERVLVWSERAQEQEILAGTPLSGDLATEPADSPEVGLYLNDGTAAKMDYYLDYEASVESTHCQAERQYLTVTATFKSNAPADTDSLPDYVTGSVDGISRGNVRTTVLLYAPVDGYFEEVAVDGEQRPANEVTHEGRDVISQTIELAPGASTELSYEVVTGAGQTDTARLSITPGANGRGIGSISGSACS